MINDGNKRQLIAKKHLKLHSTSTGVSLLLAGARTSDTFFVLNHKFLHVANVKESQFATATFLHNWLNVCMYTISVNISKLKKLNRQIKEQKGGIYAE